MTNTKTMTTKKKTNPYYLKALMALAATVMALLLVVGSGAAMAADQAKGATAPSGSSDLLSAQGARLVTKTFSNSSPIPADPSASQGPAAPYPSEIAVSGFRKGSRITNVKVNLFGLSHEFPDDIDLLLVGPKGQNIILMSDVGGRFSVQNINLSLDDAFEAAEGQLPDDQLIALPNTSVNEFTPTNIGSGDTFPAPAPTPSTANKLSVFNGTNPNGTWKLFALDDEAHKREVGQPPDVGELSGGWSLEITAKRRHHH